MRWQRIDHHLHLWLKTKMQSQSRILVACSGGADSVALLRALHRVASPLGLHLVVGHVHHGPGSNQEYRAQALEFTQQLAAELGLAFVFGQADRPIGQSEAELREFRHDALNQLMQESKVHSIALGHHADDLLETRVFRLIRGTGLHGLGSMLDLSPPYLRPLLAVGSREIREYLALLEQPYLEDPTNEDPNYFRNWLRKEWLPRLEQKQPGSLESLKRSLETIVSEYQSIAHGSELDEVYSQDLGISRTLFLALSSQEQLTVLARYLRQAGVHKFSRGQLQEVQKRLADSSKVASSLTTNEHLAYFSNPVRSPF